MNFYVVKTKKFGKKLNKTSKLKKKIKYSRKLWRQNSRNLPKLKFSENPLTYFARQTANKKADQNTVSSSPPTTPSSKSVSDFRLFPGMPLCQGSCMDPIWPETEVGKILDVRPPEIGVPVTPGMSHGTKIFGSKIFSYHPQMMLFYVFCQFVLQKMPKIMKNCIFVHNFYEIGKRAEDDRK